MVLKFPRPRYLLKMTLVDVWKIKKCTGVVIITYNLFYKIWHFDRYEVK